MVRNLQEATVRKDVSMRIASTCGLELSHPTNRVKKTKQIIEQE